MRVALLLVALLLAGCSAPAPSPATTGPGPTPAPQPTTFPSPSPGATLCVLPFHEGCPTWDLDHDGVPRFSTALHLDLDRVLRVSRFRSGAGHDYTQGTNETCRSMKHYFEPVHDGNESALEIRSPVDGRIVRADPESNALGVQPWIQVASHPGFAVVLFHVVLDPDVRLGSEVHAGARIGHHVGSQTSDDVAVMGKTPQGMRLVSYVDTLTDGAFAPFAARNLTRADLVLPQAWRDAHPLACDGERFVENPTPEQNWVALRAT